jgi:hypothetical protein
MVLDGPVRAGSVLEAIGGKLWTGSKPPSEMHFYRGAPAVRSWSRFQEADKRISLCAATLPKTPEAAPTLPGTLRRCPAQIASS